MTEDGPDFVFCETFGSIPYTPKELKTFIEGERLFHQEFPDYKWDLDTTYEKSNYVDAYMLKHLGYMICRRGTGIRFSIIKSKNKD